MLDTVTHIARAFQVFETRPMIHIPYHFGNHWICIRVDFEYGMAWVLYSMDKDPVTYKDFLSILRTAYRFYRRDLKGKPNKRGTDDLYIKTRFPCHKQRPGSGHYGYYVCEFIRVNGQYRRHPERWPKNLFADDVSMDDDHLLEIVNDLCKFILDEIIHKLGRYHDPSSQIARQANCRLLREWESLNLGR
ncbi:hypothetical protein ACP4OV_026850 [Aristida adscensionis]